MVCGSNVDPQALLLWSALYPFGSDNLFPRLPQRCSGTSEGCRKVFLPQVGKATGSRVQLIVRLRIFFPYKWKFIRWNIL